ncbi:hypothetical protein SLS62_003352 [Diatrype stigma]|uniref:Methyltransferase n=1 Tax=Diatrype stigma TaxID=117547 RepID=A0AAN9UYF1_9PEZI
MAITALQPSLTTNGTVDFFNGTKDGAEAYVDYTDRSNNLKKPLKVGITAQDLRYATPRLTYQTDNFELRERPTTLTAEQFENDSPEGKKLIEELYYPDCKALVEEVTGCKNVHPFMYQTRCQPYQVKDIFNNRVKHAGLGAVHVDRDLGNLEVRLDFVFGEGEAARLLREHKRIGIVNVWRPVGVNAEVLPLTLIKHTAVPDMTYDSHMRRVYSRNDPMVSIKGIKGHETSLIHDHRFVYYYASNQTPDEVLIFNSFDTDVKKVVPHAGFWDNNTRPDAPDRRSVEVRCFVFYDDE